MILSGVSIFDFELGRLYFTVFSSFLITLINGQDRKVFSLGKNVKKYSSSSLGYINVLITPTILRIGGTNLTM